MKNTGAFFELTLSEDKNVPNGHKHSLALFGIGFQIIQP